MVVILGLYHGDRKFEKIDAFCQIGAIVGLILWYAFNSPLTAIVAVTLIDFIAAIPTYRHIWIKPNEETLSAFVVCALAAVLTLLAISNTSITGLVYPVYIFLANFIMASMIIFRRKQKLTFARKK